MGPSFIILLCYFFLTENEKSTEFILGGKARIVR